MKIEHVKLLEANRESKLEEEIVRLISCGYTLFGPVSYCINNHNTHYYLATMVKYKIESL